MEKLKALEATGVNLSLEPSKPQSVVCVWQCLGIVSAGLRLHLIYFGTFLVTPNRLRSQGGRGGL